MLRDCRLQSSLSVPRTWFSATLRNKAPIDFSTGDNKLVRKICPGTLSWALRTCFKSWMLVRAWNKVWITRAALQASLLLIPAVFPQPYLGPGLAAPFVGGTESKLACGEDGKVQLSCPEYTWRLLLEPSNKLTLGVGGEKSNKQILSDYCRGSSQFR